MTAGVDRRTFLTRAAAAGGGLISIGAVERLVARDALAQARHGGAQPYGRLRRVADQRGVEVLALPAGFSYVTFSHSGSTMSDGNPTPLALDGMGAFAGRRRHGHDHLVRLVRNSEDRNPAGTPGGLLGDRSAAYDPTAFGGTTTLVFDEHRRRLVQDFVSLNGTTVNCAGGIAYRRRYWLTGEETVGGPDATDPAARFAKRHGYLFQTPVDRGPNELEVGEPIVAAGRFSHEAAAVDQRTGTVYETEDPGSGLGAGFYRYTPDDRDDLVAGGRLEMLAVAGQPRVDLRQGRTRGEALPVRWVKIDEPDPSLTAVGDPRSTFNQGWAKGGAKFNRLEGCWEEDSTIFFVSTSGGDAKNGDVNSDALRRGLRPGVGLPAGQARRRDAHARVRVAVRERHGCSRQPHRDAARGPDRVRGRRLDGVRRHAPARAGDRERQPADRADPLRVTHSSSRSTCSTARSWPGPASARAVARCSSTSSAAPASTRPRSKG